jgi:membrane protease YdiL (CAAX protease family)
VTRILNSDVTKLLAYFVSCFLLAALISPWIYNAGMFLAEFTENGTENEFLDWLGGKARNAEFPTFFKRCLLLSALLLLVPLVFSLRLSRKPASLRDSPWSFYLPPHAVAGTQGQPLRNPPLGWLQLITGFLLAAGLLFGMGLILIAAGWFRWEEGANWGEALKKATTTAIFASVAEELLFRGALLGIFLRAFRPFWAITLLSVLFALLHFLQPSDTLAIFDRSNPIPDGATYINPEGSLAGFELLRLLGLRFLDPLPFLYEFATLTVVGLILAFARYATSSLWLPIGIHAGWVFAFRLFGKVTDRGERDPSLELYIGANLKEGLIPLATLTVTAVLVYVYTLTLRPRRIPEPTPPSPPAPTEPSTL